MGYRVVWPKMNIGTNDDGSAKVAKRGDLIPEDIGLDLPSLVVVGAIQVVDDPEEEKSQVEEKKVLSSTSAKSTTSTTGKTLSK